MSTATAAVNHANSFSHANPATANPATATANATATPNATATALQMFVDPYAANYGRGFQKIPYLDAHALKKMALEREQERARQQAQAEEAELRQSESERRMHHYDDERYRDEYYMFRRDYPPRERDHHAGYHSRSHPHAHEHAHRESERRYQRDEYRDGREAYSGEEYQRGYHRSMNEIYDERNGGANNYRPNHGDYRNHNNSGYSRDHERYDGDYNNHYHERDGREGYAGRERDANPRDWHRNGRHERHRGGRDENEAENWNHEWHELQDNGHANSYEYGNADYDSHTGNANVNEGMEAENEGWDEAGNGDGGGGDEASNANGFGDGDEDGGGGDDQYYEGYDSLPTSFGRKRNANDNGGGGCGRPQNRPRLNNSKYYHQRYLLFRRYDQGIRLDKVGWYSATPESIAAHIAQRFRECLPPRPTIIDAFCGAAGNVIQFALPRVGGAHVLAVELCTERLSDARHNAKVYQVEHLVDWIHGNAFHILPSLSSTAVDAVFLSPPWGGPEYLDAETYDLNLFKDIMKIAKKASPNIAILVPRNIQWQQAVELWGDCEVEFNYLCDKLKTVTIYFGELVRQRTTMESGPSTVELYEDDWEEQEEYDGNHQGAGNYAGTENGNSSGTQAEDGINNGRTQSDDVMVRRRRMKTLVHNGKWKQWRRGEE